jgi:cytidylate kinase
MPRKPIIAIDGPAGSGKSTLAKALALKLGLTYIDTGAMYRAVTLACLRKGIDFSDGEAVSRIAHETKIELKTTPSGTRVFLGGEDVEDQIRTPEVSKLTSQVTANIRGVREALVSRQWDMGHEGGVVMEGRDIGTVVFPDADLKVYFEVSVEERSSRRIKDFKERGIAFDEDKVRADIENRDIEDKTRHWGALKRAADAVLISGDGKSVEELAEEIMEQLPRSPS